jgi:hypothetical protein
VGFSPQIQASPKRAIASGGNIELAEASGRGCCGLKAAAVHYFCHHEIYDWQPGARGGERRIITKPSRKPGEALLNKENKRTIGKRIVRLEFNHF